MENLKRLIELNTKVELTKNEIKERDYIIGNIYYCDKDFRHLIENKIENYTNIYNKKPQNDGKRKDMDFDEIFYDIVYNLLLNFKGEDIKNLGGLLHNYLFKKQFGVGDRIDSYFNAEKQKKKYYFTEENLGFFDDINELSDTSGELLNPYMTFEEQDRICSEYDSFYSGINDKIKEEYSNIKYINTYSVSLFDYFCRYTYDEAIKKYNRAKENKLKSWEKWKNSWNNKKPIKYVKLGEPVKKEIYYKYSCIGYVKPQIFDENINLDNWKSYIKSIIKNKLNKIEKEVIIRYFWGIQDTQEIAEELNLKRNTINKYKNQALDKIKYEIEDNIGIIEKYYSNTPLDYYSKDIYNIKKAI